MNHVKLVLLLLFTPLVVGIAQDRDLAAERLVLDDDASDGTLNTLTLEAPALTADRTITLPDESGTLLLAPGGGFNAGEIIFGSATGGLTQSSSFTWDDANSILDVGGRVQNSSGILRISDNVRVDNYLRLHNELRFRETGAGGDYVGFVAPPAIGANLIWTLPDADGDSGQVLSTNGSGVLSWTNPTNTFAQIGGIGFARKTADESTTSGTLQDDDDLSIALNANETYEVYGVLYATKAQSNGRLLLAIDVPAGSTIKIDYHTHTEDGAGFGVSDVLVADGATANRDVPLSTTKKEVVIVTGLVVTGGMADDMVVQWAINNPNGTRTVSVEENSFIRVVRVE